MKLFSVACCEKLAAAAGQQCTAIYGFGVLGTVGVMCAVCEWRMFDFCFCLKSVVGVYTAVSLPLQRYESRVAELEDMVARQSEVGSLSFSDEEVEEQFYGTSRLSVHVHVCVWCECMYVAML